MELVGRGPELASLVERLDARWLVTITGPGGIGKTTLAQAAVEQHTRGGHPSAAMVDLTRIETEDAVPDAVAGQLGLPDLAAVVDSPWVAGRLVVLDNCEHVLDAAAELAVCLRDTVGDVTILATSRSPLDLPGESVLALGPLALPAVDDAGDDAPALRVLLARARDAGVDPDGIDRAAAAEICRRLDGMPLALELAAARLRSMSAEEVLVALHDDASVLSRPRFRGRRSHRSVADLVEWSIALLGDEARRGFETLGILAGPFTAESAHAVVADGHDRPDASREVLDDLVDASLLVADTRGTTTWYRMLHPVRAVARARLERRGDVDAVQRRLADHVVVVALAAIASSASGWSRDDLSHLLTTYDDVAAAVRWAVAHDDAPERAFTLVALLWGVIHQAHTAEVYALGQQVLARWPDPALPGRADAVATVATCHYLLGDPAGAIAMAEEALADASGSIFAPVTLRRLLGQAHRALGHLEVAHGAFAEAAGAAEELGSAGLAMELWVDDGMLQAQLGDLDGGLQIIEKTLDRARRAGAEVNVAWALGCRAAVLLGRSVEQALPAIHEALDASRSIGYPAGVSFCLRLRALAHLQGRDLVAAAGTVTELLQELARQGGSNDLRMALDLAAHVTEATGQAGWQDLAVTAASLPVTTIIASTDTDLFARAHGQGVVLEVRQARRLAHDAMVAVAAPAGNLSASGPTSPGAAMAALRRTGDVCTFVFAGGEVAVRASKGVHDLAQLLAAPGREIAALDLMGGGLVDPVAGDELVDATARRQYAERVRELQADIEEADALHDSVRAEGLRIELDTLVDHLTRSTGLRGRSRRTSTSAERARSAVTQRIRATIRRIAEHHPDLGRHLEAFVSTGTWCSYHPVPPVTWEVDPAAGG